MPQTETISVGTGRMRIAVGRPDGDGRPGVVVMIHGLGLDQFIETQVDALARAGFVAVAHLATLTGGPLGVLGFCTGGRNAYLAAGARPQFWKAAGVFYGGNIMKAWGDGPSPFDRTSQIACPMIGLFGADDPNPTPADVAAIDAELRRFGKPHEFHVYPGAGHAFLNFMNGRHRPVQAADAWFRLLAFFRQHLR